MVCQILQIVLTKQLFVNVTLSYICHNTNITLLTFEFTHFSVLEELSHISIVSNYKLI